MFYMNAVLCSPPTYAAERFPSLEKGILHWHYGTGDKEFCMKCSVIEGQDPICCDCEPLVINPDKK
jgi:hypothetical protein